MFGMTKEPAHAGVERISALLEDWMPPSRGNWEIILFVFQWIYPTVRDTHTYYPYPSDSHRLLTLSSRWHPCSG